MTDKKPYATGAATLILIIVEVVFWAVALGIFFVLKKFTPNISLHNMALWPLVFLLPAAAVIFILFLSWRNVALKRLADYSLLPYLAPGLSPLRATIKFIVWRFGLAFLIIGLLDPKVGSRLEEVETRGIDLMVAIDVSNSMLAEDLKPNRLNLAKRTVQRMINELKGDRIGIVVFAGDAYVQLPITSDVQAAKVFLDAIETGSVPKQGTAIGAAIDLCVGSFDERSEAGKAIIILTDGENHEDDAKGAASRAADAGISVYCIGMGTVQGAPIPVYNRTQRSGFKTDKEGNTVVTSLNEQMLIDVVKNGNGLFILSGETFVNLNPLFDDFNKMEKADMGITAYTDYEHRYAVFLLLACVCFVIDLMIGERKLFLKI
ncbi:MAG: VWA domain-containing protein [Cryomorphaceae bacterium]|nr:VWA domain-containing protein [Cryomorphaceae bacterium]